jgi:hypothetical protein
MWNQLPNLTWRFSDLLLVYSDLKKLRGIKNIFQKHNVVNIRWIHLGTLSFYVNYLLNCSSVC